MSVLGPGWLVSTEGYAPATCTEHEPEQARTPPAPALTDALPPLAKAESTGS